MKTKRLIFALLTLSLLSNCNNSQTKSVTKNDRLELVPQPDKELREEFEKEQEKLEVAPYDFDTLLKNNFHLSYRVFKDTIENEMLQSLTLVKGNKDVKQISETSFPMLHKNLGYIGADFGSSFLFVQSYGSGNPHEIQLIEKETAKVITEGVLVDSNETEKVLLYIKEEHQKKEKLILLDIKMNTEKTITAFDSMECTQIGSLRNCVEIDTITKDQIVLKSSSEQQIIKKYKR